MSDVANTSFFVKDRDFNYHFCNIKNFSNQKHTHTFYEYFFVLSGSATHVYNGHEILLEKGDLFLIGPEDEHDFLAIDNQYCEWVNVAFFTSYIEKLFDYLDIDKNKFFNENKNSMYLKLSKYNLDEFIREHEYLNVIFEDDLEIGLYIKKLLLKVVNMFILQFRGNNKKNNYFELFELFNDANNLQILQQGVPALVSLSGFSHEYLCRIMKKYFNITPSKYVTDLRLSYSLNLLLHSDLNIMDISSKVGYFSFGHFMKLFKNKYGCTPYQFRKSHEAKKQYNRLT